MRKRMIRIFISSTFGEFENERNYLESTVFKELEALCRKNSFSFQIIDLRWGVSRQAALNNRTVEICFDEIERCQKLSPRPNFIVMVGNRYGWRPLPTYIPKDEWESITSQASPDKYRLLSEWYFLDENDLSERYALKQRDGNFLDNKVWAEKEEELRTCLFALAEKYLKDEKKLCKYGASATEQEIYKGLFEAEDAKNHTFVMIKEGFISNESKDDLTAANRLKIRLKRELGENADKQLCTYNEGEKIYGEKLKNFLEGIIKEQIKNAGGIDSSREEEEAFENEWTYIKTAYIERRGIDEAFETFCEKHRGRAVLVTGASGVGKSFFLKHWAEKNRSCCIGFFPDILLSRSRLSDGFMFCFKNLEDKGLLSHIADPASFENISEWLLAHLKNIKSHKGKKPVTLIIDSVENISDIHRFPLNILKERLSPDVTLIISCTDKLNLDIGREAEEIPCFEIKKMDKNSTMDMLKAKLRERNRRLSPVQLENIRSLISEENTPLDTEILAEFCKSIKSGERISFELQTHMFTYQNSLIRARLESLGREGYSVLYRHALGYLALSADGLSETEMLDLLTRDEDVIKEVMDETKKTSGRNRSFTVIPTVLWARVYYDIRENLSEIYQRGKLLMRFRHQNFGKHILEMSGGKIYTLARRMQAYFEEAEWNSISDVGEAVPNLRKIRESYNIDKFSDDKKALRKLLENPLYTDGCIRCGMYEDVVSQISDFLDNSDKNLPVSEAILSLLKNKAQLFQTFPDSYIQAAAGEGLAGTGEVKSTGKSYFFASETPQNEFVPMKAEGTSFAVNKNKILAALSGGKIRLYDMNTYTPLDSFCKTGTDDGVLYWENDELIFRAEYIRIHYRFSNRQLYETNREETPSYTNLIYNGKGFLPNTSLTEINIFNAPSLTEGTLRYYDEGTMKEIYFPIGGEGNIKLRKFGSKLAAVTDSSRAKVYDLELKTVLSEYHYLMIKNVYWSETGEYLLLILTNGRVALVPAGKDNREIEFNETNQGKKPLDILYEDVRSARWLSLLGMERLLDILYEAVSSFRHPIPGLGKPLDLLHEADGVSILFSEIIFPKKGDYPIRDADWKNTARKPIFAAFSEGKGLIACYYRYGCESIVVLYNIKEGNKPVTFLTEPIYEKDSVNKPFYFDEDGEKLVLISSGRRIVLNTENYLWKKDGKRTLEKKSTFEEDITEKYFSEMKKWLPQNINMLQLQPVKKSLKDKASDICFSALMLLMFPYTHSLKSRISPKEFAEQRLKGLRLEKQGSLYWLVDTDNGIIQVFDSRGKCLCREQTGEKILAYELQGTSLKFLRDGTFSFETAELCRLS